LGLPAANVLEGPGLYRYTIGALQAFFRYPIICESPLYWLVIAHLLPIRANLRNKTPFSAPILLFLYGGFSFFRSYIWRYASSRTGGSALLEYIL